MYDSKQFVGKEIERQAPLNILIIGAHPDDPDFTAAGVAALYSRRGHHVKMVSVTNGDAGHHAMGGVPLAQRRRKEAQAAGACLGAEYITLDNHDSVLMPTLEIRHQLVRIIREFKPDLVFTPRPNDYHPDHRCTSQLVQDAVCSGSIPNIVSDVPYLLYTPSVMYVWDGFQKPYPFQPDVVVAIDDVIETKLDALHCHTSQMYEFLPYIKRYIDQVPAEADARRAWLRSDLEPRLRRVASLYPERLANLYGEEQASRVLYAEAFEFCEYGAAVSEADIPRLFPFFPAAA